MNCTETRRLVHAYVDRELDLAGSLAIEQHMAGCAECRQRLARIRNVSNVVATHAGFRPAPDALTRRVRRHVRDISAACAGPWRLRAWLAMALPVAALASALVGWFGWNYWAGDAVSAAASEKVVYHINNSDEATNTLRNVANHLETSPDARIVVVAHNYGVDFLLKGATDARGRPYEAEVSQLTARGVDFRACKITLVRREVDLSTVIPQASLVPSGIVEITRLQVKEGFAYLKP